MKYIRTLVCNLTVIGYHELIIFRPARLMNDIRYDGYYVAYKPITLSCILLMFIEMKFIYCHSCVMFAMKSMSMCND